MAEDYGGCPTCGGPVRVLFDHDGASHYKPSHPSQAAITAMRHAWQRALGELSLAQAEIERLTRERDEAREEQRQHDAWLTDFMCAGGEGLCDEHEAAGRQLPFAEFCRRRVDVGCIFCRVAERDAARRVLVEVRLRLRQLVSLSKPLLAAIRYRQDHDDPASCMALASMAKLLEEVAAKAAPLVAVAPQTCTSVAEMVTQHEEDDRDGAD